MEKKWFILYTKPGTEKKVVASLAKKRIEHYLPMCYKGGDNNMTGKRAKEPLFEGYVFVETTADELMGIQKSVGALSVVYWKGTPVILSIEEILSLQIFISKHDQIALCVIEIIGKRCFESKSADTSTTFIINKAIENHLFEGDELILNSLGSIITLKKVERLNVNSIFQVQDVVLG